MSMIFIVNENFILNNISHFIHFKLSALSGQKNNMYMHVGCDDIDYS